MVMVMVPVLLSWLHLRSKVSSGTRRQRDEQEHMRGDFSELKGASAESWCWRGGRGMRAEAEGVSTEA